MKNYLDLLQDILDNGSIRNNERTGVGTKSVFGRTLRWDLSEGFPLITTKRMFFRGVVEELLWFLRGETDSKILEDKKINIWKGNTSREFLDQKGLTDYPEGEAGPVYGKQWVAWEPHRVLRRVAKIKAPISSEVSPLFFPLKKPPVESGLCGSYVETNHSGTVLVLEKCPDTVQGHDQYIIQFQTSGYEKKVRVDALLQGEVNDPYQASVCGRGYLGTYKPTTDLDQALKRTWAHMMNRCYNPQCKEYSNYGGKGVFVHSDWWNFSTFVKEVMTIANSYGKRRNPSQYQIDKDYFGSRCYSKETCVWLTLQENNLYQERQPFKVYKDGEFLGVEISQTEVALKFDLFRPSIGKVLRGERKSHKGFTFSWFEDEGFVYRYPLPINQIQKLVSTIKDNPQSRRILVSAWNPGELDLMCLPPCHWAFQCYVEGGRLSLMFQMRSTDCLLGLPFNIASYATLTHILAKLTNLEPGELIFNGGDTHLYMNHMDQVTEQLGRKPFPLPQLKINKELSTLEDVEALEFTDFELVGYQHHPPIKAPMAV